jgi:hypothetical protein
MLVWPLFANLARGRLKIKKSVRAKEKMVMPATLVLIVFRKRKKKLLNQSANNIGWCKV